MTTFKLNLTSLRTFNSITSYLLANCVSIKYSFHHWKLFSSFPFHKLSQISEPYPYSTSHFWTKTITISIICILKLIFNDLFVPLNPQIFLIVMIPNFSLITCRNIKLPTWIEMQTPCSIYYRGYIFWIHASQQQVKYYDIKCQLLFLW